MKQFSRILQFTGLLAALLVSCTPKETRDLLGPSQALGAVLAEETVRVAGAGKSVVLLLPQWNETSTVEQSFRAAFRKQGGGAVTVRIVDIGDPMRRGPIGLKGADLLAAFDQAAGAGAVISLAGVPLFQPGDEARLNATHLPVVVVACASLGNVPGVTGDPLRVASLLEARIIQSAIIDGGDPSAPKPAKPDAVHELFAQNFRLLHRPN